MSSYAIGVIFGRLLASYLIVLVILFLFARFKHKEALRRSVKWYGFVLTSAVFIAGLASSSLAS